MTITLREINKHNWKTALKLKLEEQQKHFVAPNWYSMLEVQFGEYEAYDRGIYHHDTMIGYAMMGRDPDNQRCFVIRLMIDTEHQRKGYGRAAMNAIIDEMKVRYAPDAIFISFEPENSAARKLYESLGFVDTGEIIDDELLFRLSLAPAQ